jgi:hypothetical protein
MIGFSPIANGCIPHEQTTRNIAWQSTKICLMKSFELYKEKNHLLLKRAFYHFGENLHFFKWLTLIKQVLYSGEIPLDVILIVQSLFMFLSPYFMFFLMRGEDQIMLLYKRILINNEGYLCFHYDHSYGKKQDLNKAPRIKRMDTTIGDNPINILRIGDYNFVITPKRLYYQYYEDVGDRNGIDEDFDGLEITTTKGGQFLTILSVDRFITPYWENEYSMRGCVVECDEYNLFNIRYIEKESGLMFNHNLFEYDTDKQCHNYPFVKEITIRLPSYKTRNVKRLQNDSIKKDQQFIDVSECEISEKYCENCRRLFPLEVESEVFTRGSNLVHLDFIKDFCYSCRKYMKCDFISNET